MTVDRGRNTSLAKDGNATSAELDRLNTVWNVIVELGLADNRRLMR
ncbi:hypothetical protein [Pseudomonas sp. SLFW]|nr:hypothetical protein [Pseudomonas sp. SLFW]NBB12424.1 hypothetical protein [Pseudomonas sp. SLFW]